MHLERRHCPVVVAVHDEHQPHRDAQREVEEVQGDPADLEAGEARVANERAPKQCQIDGHNRRGLIRHGENEQCAQAV